MFEQAPRFEALSGTENQEDVDIYLVDVASGADLEQLNAAFPPPEDDPEQHQFSLELQEKGEGKFFVLRHSEEITGQATLGYNWQSPHRPDIKGPVIMGVEIVEQERGQGLVDKLLTACEQDVAQRGDRELYVDVAENNLAAIKAYQRNGYEEVPNTRHTLPKDVDPEQIASFYLKKILKS